MSQKMYEELLRSAKVMNEKHGFSVNEITWSEEDHTWGYNYSEFKDRPGEFFGAKCLACGKSLKKAGDDCDCP